MSAALRHMGRRPAWRLLAVVGVLVVFGLFPALARADGEVGLVIQNGDDVTTLCVPYTGASITGDQLLQKAGVPFGQFGGGAVCSLGTVGCFAPSDFNSCFCQCSGGNQCTYWAFFTQKYGQSWVYSPVAFTAARSQDGDLQGWKWGAGSLSNAPVPKPITFEQVCGHAPQGGASVATATATSPPPTAAVTQPPGATATGSPGVTVTLEPTSTETFTPLPGEGSPTVTASIGTTASPGVATVPPVLQQPTSSGGGGNATTVVTFAVVAAALAAAIGFAIYWRRSHGR